MLSLFRNLFSPPRDLIIIMAAFWFGITLSEKRAQKHGILANDLNNMLFYSLLGYGIGGRIMFALEKLPAFIESPMSIFSINLDLFDPIGGLAIAFIVALIFGQRKNLSLWPTLDALTPLFAIVTISLALAHLASGNAFGKPTSLPWGMDLWGATRHPSQFYALFASILTFGVLWFQKTDLGPGYHFLTFVAITSGWHLFLEAFRGDSILIFGGIRLVQFFDFFVLALSLFLLEKMSKNSSEMITRNYG